MSGKKKGMTRMKSLKVVVNSHKSGITRMKSLKDVHTDLQKVTGGKKRLSRMKTLKMVHQNLQKIAELDQKAKERERIAIERLRKMKKKEDKTALKKRNTSSVNSVAGMQKIMLMHNIAMKAEREKRLADIGHKTLNNMLRQHSNADELKSHIRRKIVALSYGCLDITTFYRRLFASFDTESDEVLNVDEIACVLRKYCNVAPQDVRTALAIMDTNDTGDVDFDEFFNFLDIKEKKTVNIKKRDIPLSPRSKIEWCLQRVGDQEDLTYSILMLKGLADKQPPLVFLKKGAVMILWNIVLEYTIQHARADDVLEGEAEAIAAARALGQDVSLQDMQHRNGVMRVHRLKSTLSPQKAALDAATPFPELDDDNTLPQITLEQRDTAIEILELWSNSFAVLSSKLKDVPLPDPEQLMFELHVRSIHIAKNHVKGSTEDDDFSDDDDSDDDEEEDAQEQTLEERLARMRAKVEATRLRVQEEKTRKAEAEAEAAAAAAEGGDEAQEKVIQQLIDVEEILFLMRCIYAQIGKLDQIRMFQLLECVLLMIGEGRHHEVMGLTRAHRRVAQSILAKFRSVQVEALLKALKKSNKVDYIHRIITRTAKKVVQGMKQAEATKAKWDNIKRAERQRVNKLAFEKKKKIETLEKVRRQTMTKDATKIAKRKLREDRQRLLEESKQQKVEEERRQRATHMKKRLRAEQKAQKKINKIHRKRRSLEMIRKEEEREKQNQEAMREWRRAKAQKKKKQEAKMARRKSKGKKRKGKHKKDPYVMVRLPTLGRVCEGEVHPDYALESYAGAAASYGGHATRSDHHHRPKEYVNSRQIRAEAAQTIAESGRTRRRGGKPVRKHNGAKRR